MSTAARNATLSAVAAMTVCAASAASSAADKAFEAIVRYRPYHEVIAVEAAWDTSREDIPAAATFTLTVRAQDSENAVLDKQWPVTGESPAHREFKASLEPGRYDATLHVLARDGRAIAQHRSSIVRQTFPWEHNGIGRRRKVVAPFEPIGVSGAAATVWGRSIDFAPAGLPAQITVQGEPILRAPGIGLTLITADDESHELAPDDDAFALRTPDGYDATSASAGTLGALRYEIEGALDYDGFYLVRLTVDPRDEPVEVSSLVLNIPLWRGADTFSFQKNDRDLYASAGGMARFAGFDPQTPGKVFDARTLPAMSAYNLRSANHFVPAIFVGSGARGLWYYAVRDHDWHLNPANEHATLDVADRGPRLRIWLVNDAMRWDQKRVFEFALMPEPVKPTPDDARKIVWGYPDAQYIHDTAGWRYYGDGVNSFSLPDDAAYKKLGEVITRQRPVPKNVHGKPPVRKPGDDRPLILYGSSLMAGQGNDAWHTYGAEWVSLQRLHHTEDRSVRERFRGHVSYGGHPWTEPDQFLPGPVQWSDSWLDFFVYHHRKLVRRVGPAAAHRGASATASHRRDAAARG